MSLQYIYSINVPLTLNDVKMNLIWLQEQKWVHVLEDLEEDNGGHPPQTCILKWIVICFIDVFD